MVDLQSFAGVPGDHSSSLSGVNTTPSMFCHSCFLKLKRDKIASQEGLPFQPMVAMDWPSHSEEDCKVINNNKIIIIIIKWKKKAN